jgi:hypothetical protein
MVKKAVALPSFLWRDEQGAEFFRSIEARWKLPSNISKLKLYHFQNKR